MRKNSLKRRKYNRIKAIVFDLDNTLFPTRKFVDLARENAINSMIEAGLQVNKEKVKKELEKIIQKKGSNYPHHFDDLIAKIAGKKNLKLIAAGIMGYHKTKNSILPFPDVPLTLLKLREKYRLFVLSQGVELKQWDKLILLNLHHYFEEVFVCEKKDECAFEKLLQSLKKKGIKRDEMLMVGDNEEKDIIPARKTGISALLLGRDIKSISELLKILK